ncbi:MAG: hypothetical protein CL483_14800 [Acidobacteria bacterium]|nr:hypothetical protein [Acidobacteriota bacterium]
MCASVQKGDTGPEDLARRDGLGFAQGEYCSFYYHHDDQNIGRALRERGYYERSLLVRVVSHIARHDPDARGKHFVDVGANIGTTCITALTQFSFTAGIAVEPVDENFQLLELNRRHNGLESRLTLVHAAASRANGTLMVRLSEKNPGAHRVLERPSEKIAPDAMREVPAVTLDRVLEEAQVQPERVGLVWMDTQGHEGRVLEGAAGVCAARVPLCLEFWPKRLRKSGGVAGLIGTLARHYTHFADMGGDVRHKIPSEPLAELDTLSERYASRHTEIVVLNASPGQV